MDSDPCITSLFAKPEKKKTRQNQQSYFRKDKNTWENAQLNQQKNTSTVIIWFIPTQDKHLHSFLIFGIKDFYSSIKEKLLRKALKFVESYTDISDEGKRIINHSRKSLLFNSKQAWIKKESTLFDVTKKAGAKVCQLVVSFTLSTFKNKCKKKRHRPISRWITLTNLSLNLAKKSTT